MQPHIEGMLIQGGQGLDVGDRLRAKLIRTDAQKGYIDFVRVQGDPLGATAPGPAPGHHGSQ